MAEPAHMSAACHGGEVLTIQGRSAKFTVRNRNREIVARVLAERQRQATEAKQ
jgi:hypothetical protein